MADLGMPAPSGGASKDDSGRGVSDGRLYLSAQEAIRAHVCLRLSAVAGGRWLSDAPKGAVGEPWTIALKSRNRTS